LVDSSYISRHHSPLIFRIQCKRAVIQHLHEEVHP
jgi:hypothetical protein